MQRIVSQFSKRVVSNTNSFQTSSLALAPAGRIKFFAQGKGYGFIVQDEGSDLFYHITDFETPVQDVPVDERVVFDVAEGRKGLMAKNIRFENESFEEEGSSSDDEKK
jgi:cold shock protein